MAEGRRSTVAPILSYSSIITAFFRREAADSRLLGFEHHERLLRILFSPHVVVPRRSDLLHPLLPNENHTREFFLHSNAGKYRIRKSNVPRDQILFRPGEFIEDLTVAGARHDGPNPPLLVSMLTCLLHELTGKISINEENRHLCGELFDSTHSSSEVKRLPNVGTLEKWIRL